MLDLHVLETESKLKFRVFFVYVYTMYMYMYMYNIICIHWQGLANLWRPPAATTINISVHASTINISVMLLTV